MTSKKTVSARDAGRNIGDELLQAIRDVKGGKFGAKYQVEANDVVKARLKSGLSQAQFASALHISPRTLQQWEQGRRHPSGAGGRLDRLQSRSPPGRGRSGQFAGGSRSWSSSVPAATAGEGLGREVQNRVVHL